MSFNVVKGTSVCASSFVSERGATGTGMVGSTGLGLRGTVSVLYQSVLIRTQKEIAGSIHRFDLSYEEFYSVKFCPQIISLSNLFPRTFD